MTISHRSTSGVLASCVCLVLLGTCGCQREGAESKGEESKGEESKDEESKDEERMTDDRETGQDAETMNKVDETAKEPDAGTVYDETPRSYETLSHPQKIPFPVELDYIYTVASDADTLLVYGVDLVDRGLKRFDLTGANTWDVSVLRPLDKYGHLHPRNLPTCGANHCIAGHTPEEQTAWYIVQINRSLEILDSTAIPYVGEEGFIVPQLSSDGATTWVIWSTNVQTQLHRYRDNHLVVTLNMQNPRGLFAPRTALVVWGDRLYMLSHSSVGLEAVLIDDGGVVHRDLLSSQQVDSFTLARVDDRLFAVWVEPTSRKTTRMSVAGAMMGQWLDGSLRRLGDTEQLGETHSTISDLHLWASDDRRLVIGRTDRWRGGVIPHHSHTEERPVYQPGFMSMSSIADYDVPEARIGAWQELGVQPIFTGVWIDDELFVVIDNHAHNEDPFDLSRLQRFPAYVIRFGR